jgi:phosphate transport system permease protein
MACPPSTRPIIALDVYLDPAKLDKNGNRAPEDLSKITTFTDPAAHQYGDAGHARKRGICSRRRQRQGGMAALISKEAPADLRRFVLANPDQIGETISFDLLASGRIDGYFKGRVTMESAELDRNISPEQLVLADRLKEPGLWTRPASTGPFSPHLTRLIRGQRPPVLVWRFSDQPT